MFFSYRPVSEYNFKERMKVDCNPKGNKANTLEDAKKECKNDKQCQGVLQDASNDPPSYYLCPEDTTPTFGDDIKSSLLEKQIIGIIFSKLYRQSFNLNIENFAPIYLSHSLFYYDLDPCANIQCNGTNAVCKVFFGTGEAFCACPLGYKGDPEKLCCKHLPSNEENTYNSVKLFFSICF